MEILGAIIGGLFALFAVLFDHYLKQRKENKGNGAHATRASSEAESLSATERHNNTEHTQNNPKNRMVPYKKAQSVFQLDKEWRPVKYTVNKYEIKGDIVIDYATGLIWQKNFSSNVMSYDSTRFYIDRLNEKKFAGYNDWRLPTVEELVSLLEPNDNDEDLYINSIFSGMPRREWWSCNKLPKEPFRHQAVWVVNFVVGYVKRCDSDFDDNCVFAVRSFRQEKKVETEKTPHRGGMVRCENDLHFYDSGKHASCPYCLD